MFFLIGIIIGIVLGIISGLIPGLHINNFLYLLTSFNFDSNFNAILIILMSIIFSFLSIIPTTIFFVPNNENFVSSMATQKLYFKGKGYYAIILYLNGAIYSIFFGLPLFLLFIFILNYIPKLITYITPIILILTLFFLILSKKNYFGYFIIIFSAIIGYIAFNKSINNSIFPLITGLFGMSNILYYFNEKYEKINQKIITYKINLKTKFRIGILASILSIIASLFPGIGNGLATYFGAKTLKLDDEEYIMLNGGITTLVMILSFIVVYYTNKSRTASAVFFKNYLSYSTNYNLFFIIFFIILGIILSYFITKTFAKLSIKYLTNLNLKYVYSFLIILFHVLIFIFSGFLGLIIFWVSAIIGFLCINTNNPRILMLSSIIFPVLIYFI